MVRGLGIAVVLVLLCAAPAAADKVALDWSVADRLAGPASVDESAPARAVTLQVAVDSTGACPRDPRFELDGNAITSRPTAGCAFDLAPVKPGEHRLTLDGDQGDEQAEIDLDAHDLLVVSLGDSVASGEGNPDGPGIHWLEKRCHRSLRSGAAQATRAVERGDRHSVVTFVPLACSGATIDAGLLGAYDGV